MDVDPFKEDYRVVILNSLFQGVNKSRQATFNCKKIKHVGENAAFSSALTRSLSLKASQAT